MEAKFSKNGEIMVIHLEGRLDYDSSMPFREVCLKNLINEKIIFDLRQLHFVGSHGITDFVETMEALTSKSSSGVKFFGVSSEFRRLFESSQIKNLQIFDNFDHAILSFSNQVSFAPPFITNDLSILEDAVEEKPD